MLPASPQTPAPRRALQSNDRFLTVLVVVSMLYTLLLGWGVLANAISYKSAYLMMVPLCAAPIIWYSYGFLKVNETEQDFGLLLSALGWGFVAICLILKHVALAKDLNAIQMGTEIVSPGRSAAATVCLLVGVVGIVIGAVLSMHAWQRGASE